MSAVKWCITCKKELGGSSSDLGFMGLGSSTGLYCKNTKCDRYGLMTVIFLEEQKEAPENVKSNDPVGETNAK